MTKSKTDKHLTLSYKKTNSKSDLHPLKGMFSIGRNSRIFPSTPWYAFRPSKHCNTHDVM